MPTIGRIDVELRGRTQHFSASMRRADRRVSGFTQRLGVLRGAFAGLTGGLAFGALIRSTISETERLGQLSARLRVSVDQFSRLSRVMSRSGIQMNQTATMLQRLQRRAADAKAGNEQLAAVFRTLGIDLDSFLGLDPVEGFLAIGRALAQVQPQAEKIRLTFKLLDTEGVQALQTNLAGLREEMARTAPVTDAQSKSVTRLMEAWSRLGESIRSGVSSAGEGLGLFTGLAARMDRISGLLDRLRNLGPARFIEQESFAAQMFERFRRNANPVEAPRIVAPMTGTIGGSRAFESTNLDRTNALLEQIRQNTRMTGAIAQ